MSLPRSRARGGDQGLLSRSQFTTNGGRLNAALFRIPKDQEDLLAKENAWAEEQSKQPGAPPNIPLSVLRGLGEFHTRQAKVQRRNPVQMASSPPQAAIVNAPPPSTPRSDDDPDSRLTTPIARGHVMSQSIDQSPNGTEISWPSSPVRDRPTVVVHSSTRSDEASSPISRPPSIQPLVRSNRSHDFATQVQSSHIPTSTAAEPTLRPRITDSTYSPIRPAPKRNLCPHVPFSSAGNSEDELPLVPPKANDWVERVTINRLAQPCPTPPSAQVIPCSEGQGGQTGSDTPRKRRQRMQSLNNLIFDEPNEQSHPVTQESILPQRALPPVEEEPQHSEHPVTSTPEVLPPATTTSRKPYEQFKATYTDYGGDLSTFLRTCIYLKYLEDRDELIPFLYDDFIRAFAHGYLPYIQNWAVAGNPLPAIKWYNRNTTHPVYSQQVMDKAAVALAFDVYPGETRHINEGLAGAETQTAPVTERSPPPRQTSTKDRTEDEEDRIPGNPSSRRTSCSPDLSTPKSTDTRPPFLELQNNPRSTVDPWLSAPDIPSQASIIIPNTSRSILEANPTRIPETVRKPKQPQSARLPREGSMRPPSRESAGSRVQKRKQGPASKTGKNSKSLVQHFRDAMRKNPHPRLASSS
ncbi:hypothetical protein RB597_004724 [Gaeumannomyces tritici]